MDEAAKYLQVHRGDTAGSYASPENAAIAFGVVFAKESQKLGVEFGANILVDLGRARLVFRLSNFSVTTLDDIFTGGPLAGMGAVKIASAVPGSYWGMVHTHFAKIGVTGEMFSWSDWQIMILRAVNGYVIFPDQTMQSFDYSKYDPQTMTPDATFYEQRMFSF